MFIKLFKYDINLHFKTQLVLVISTLFLTLVVSLLKTLNSDILNSLLIMVCLFASAGVLISYMVFHVTSFYRTMAGGESYLTHTLPVSMSKIVFSKFIAALIWGVISISTVCLLWFVMMYGTITLGSTEKEIIGTVILIVTGQFLCMTTLVAFCISLSVHPMFGNIHSKILISVVSFIVIYYACSFIQLALLGVNMYISGNLSALISNEMNDAQGMALIKDMFGSIFITYAVLSVVFYTLSVRIFEKKKSI